MKKERLNLSFYWSRRPDLNRQPSDYKSDALPLKLLRQIRAIDYSNSSMLLPHNCICQQLAATMKVLKAPDHHTLSNIPVKYLFVMVEELEPEMFPQTQPSPST